MKKLDCRSSSDLDWEVRAKEVCLLDFGWEERALDLEDEMHFASSLLAVEEFSKTGGVAVLARNPQKLCTDLDAFSNYLERLASPLEETPRILIDRLSGPLVESVLSYCKRRFQPFELIFDGVSLPVGNSAPVGIVLSQDDVIDRSWLEKMMAREKEFTCIPEELLNEYWAGVDRLVVDRKTVSEKGRRMLYGFEATGGKISE